jgi:hypothetical protein
MLFFIDLAGFLAGVLLGCQESAVRPAEKPVPERETPAARSGVEARLSGQDFAGIPDLHSTCYDDGDACPGGCDPHVVAHADTNGSARPHAPGSAAPDWKKCRVGADCEVCYGDDPQVGCILVRFRGSGPDIGRADYTAAWWARTCERDDLPATLARECRRIRDAATSLQAKQSCLADPTSAGCAGGHAGRGRRVCRPRGRSRLFAKQR